MFKGWRGHHGRGPVHGDGRDGDYVRQDGGQIPGILQEAEAGAGRGEVAPGGAGRNLLQIQVVRQLCEVMLSSKRSKTSQILELVGSENLRFYQES